MKNRRLALVLLLASAASLPGVLPAQQGDAEPSHDPAIFTTNAVERTAKAVDYRTAGGTTQIDFARATGARSGLGVARVRSTGAAVQIEASFKDLPNPQNFGAEYLTQVLWAISPDGRVSSLGEVQTDKKGDAKLTATSDLPVFGMIVTAEPYFAVRMPSDVIVMENSTTTNTKSPTSFIDAKYELLERGVYQPIADPGVLSMDLKNTPLDVYQARNALTIATAIGAEGYADDSLRRAQASLEMANSPVIKKERDIIKLARDAVQFAEDARALTVQRRRQPKSDDRDEPGSGPTP